MVPVLKRAATSRLGLAALVAAVAAATASIAWAAIPGNGGVIHGCFAQSTGVLRVIDDSVDTCKSKETPIDWNIQGPTGPTGPTGAAGPSEAFLDANPGGNTVGSTPVTLASLDLPVGRYVVFATLRMTNATGIANGACTIDNPNVPGTDAIGGFEITSEGGEASVALSLIASGPVTLPLQCLSSGPLGPVEVSAGDVKVAAIRVGTVHVQ